MKERLMGTVSKPAKNDDDKDVIIPFPLVYALLSSKETHQYEKVLNAVVNVSNTYAIANMRPARIVTDFEKSIINACKNVLPTAQISLCAFHLGQSMYRKIV